MSISKALLSVCVLIEAMADNGEIERGSGYFVGRDLVATCWHVLSKLGGRGSIKIFINKRSYKATIFKFDEWNDCALLKVKNIRSDVTLFPLSKNIHPRPEFIGVGFPLIAERAPVPIRGEICEHDWPDPDNVPSLLLFSINLLGSSPAALSGSPIIVRKQIYGHFKKILPNTQSLIPSSAAEMGFAYACSAMHVRKLLDMSGIGARTSASTPSTNLHHQLEAMLPGVPYKRERFDERPSAMMDVLSNILQGNPFHLYGPKHIGKTFLLNRLRDILQKPIRNQRFIAAYLDLGIFSHDQLKSPEKFYRQLSIELIKALPAKFNLSATPANKPEHFESLLMEVQAKLKRNEKLVLIIDHTDELIEQINFATTLVEKDARTEMVNEFHKTMRTWIAKSRGSDLKDTLFVLSTSFSFAYLKTFASPLNNLSRLEIRDLTKQEIILFSRRYKISLSDTDCNDIIDCIGSSPMLIQIFFFDLSKRVRPEIHAIIRSEEELRRIFGEHLKQIKHELGRLNLKSPNDETTINILAMLREWNQGNLISLSSDLYVFLEQVGILKQDKERQAYRYGIYRFLVG